MPFRFTPFLTTLLLFIIVGVFLRMSAFTNERTTGNQQFLHQARYFLHGNLHVENLDTFGILDTVENATTGRYYWPLGILPSVLLMPIVYINDTFHIALRQGDIQPFITLYVLWICYALARHHKYSVTNAIFLSFAFVFSSVYALTAFVPYSWYLGQSVAVALLFTAIYELFQRRRWLYIGILMGLLLQTRLVTSLTLLMFLWEVLRQQDAEIRTKIRNIVSLLLPFAVSMLLLFLLNYARFGNIFDTGYPRALYGHETLTNARDKYGYFSGMNVVTNIYRYFLSSFNAVVEPSTNVLVFPYIEIDTKSTGFFFVSPLFIVLFLRRKFDAESAPYWVVSLMILVILLTHFTAGYCTFGPRYMLDFLPLWYILLLRSFGNRTLGLRHYLLIVVSAALNMHLILSNGFLMKL